MVIKMPKYQKAFKLNMDNNDDKYLYCDHCKDIWNGNALNYPEVRIDYLFHCEHCDRPLFLVNKSELPM